MSRLAGLESAVRALLEPPDRPLWAPAPPPEPLDPALAALLPDLPPGAWQQELTLALALRRNQGLRQAYIRAALARGGLPDRLERLAAEGVADWPAVRLRLLAAAWRADPIQLPPLALADRVRNSVAAALAYLNPAARLPAEAWEVPRLSQPPEVGEGAVFPAAVIAEALLAAGGNPAPLVRLIVQRRSSLGWSYWNPQHLPPDVDTLGQILQVLVPTLSPAELDRLVAGPVALAVAHVRESGAVPVFLADGRTWSRAAADAVWPIRECPAVAANFFTGLHLLDPERHGQAAQRGARWLLARQAETGGWESPSYCPPYGRYAACRFLARVERDAPPDLADAIRERLAGEQEAVRQAQSWDGSWGSPQATALNLSTLLALGERGAAVDAAALYLAETQQVMGCWRSEPLWLTPGPGVWPATYYESVPVTTALCLRALARWEAARRI